MSVVGTGSTEASTETSTESASIESTLDPSASADKSRILEKAKELGITGSCYESYTSKEDEPDQSAINHGADYYVIISNTDGDAYYGAVIDGEVKIWSADELYDTSGIDASKYDGNLVIKLNTPEGFADDVKVTLWCYGESDDSDVAPVEVTFSKDQDYTTGATVPTGDCNVFDYSIEGSDADRYYVEKTTFTAKDTQTIVTLDVRQESNGTADSTTSEE